MPLDVAKMRHEFERGLWKKYAWLRSNHLVCWDFLSSIDLSAGIRLVLIEYGGARLSTCDLRFLLAKEGWQISPGYALSPILRSPPRIHWTGEGDIVIGLRKTVSTDLIFSHSKLLSKFHTAGFISGDCSRFWRAIETLEPEFYVSDREQLSVVLPSSERLSDFINSAKFRNTEKRVRAKFCRERMRLWNLLGPETGPESCIQPGCGSLRISLALRCAEHQRLWGMR